MIPLPYQEIDLFQLNLEPPPPLPTDIAVMLSLQSAMTCSTTRYLTTASAPRSGVHVASPRPNVGLVGLAAAALLAASPLPSSAEIRLPPLDTDPNRCERAYVGNTIGQANAVSDKVLDLRFCDFKGKDLSGKTLSGGLLADADLTGANLSEVVMSKAYAVGANFTNANLTNAVVDRVAFDKANLSGVKFINTVITGATFQGANLENATFEDALIGNEDAKRLCNNPTLKGESRAQVGCRGK